MATGRQMAVKVAIDATAAAVAQFAAERRAARQLAGIPGVARVFDNGTTRDGRPFLVMELGGSSMSQAIRERGRLPAAEVAVLGARLAATLAMVHERGMTHGDIKPGNVLILEDGTPALADFGLSAADGAPLDSATWEFAAPEVLLGRPMTPRADLYALGATMYAAITGLPVRQRGLGESDLEFERRVLTSTTPPAVVADAPPALLNLITRLLENEQVRPSTAGEVAAGLAAFTTPVQPPRTASPAREGGDEHPTRPRLVAVDSGPVDRAKSFTWSRGTQIGLVAGSCAALALVAWLLTRGENEPDKSAAPPTSGSPIKGAPSGAAKPSDDPLPKPVMEPAQDNGTTVDLRWSGDPRLTYGVVIAKKGSAAEVRTPLHTNTLTVDVDPTTSYCFAVQVVDGVHDLVESDPVSIRGAKCGQVSGG